MRASRRTTAPTASSRDGRCPTNRIRRCSCQWSCATHAAGSPARPSKRVCKAVASRRCSTPICARRTTAAVRTHSTAAVAARSSQSSAVRPSPTRGAHCPTSTHQSRVLARSVPNPSISAAALTASSTDPVAAAASGRRETTDGAHPCGWTPSLMAERSVRTARPWSFRPPA